MYNINELRNIARSKMGSDIEQKTSSKSPINIFGTQINGEHIGIVGSILVIITLYT